MTVSATARRAGPYSCNGATVTFAFSFKVFADADLRVVKADSAGLETDLTLTTDYSVSRNADQENNPGGTITTVATYAAGNTITLVGDVAYTQTADISNSGGFFPEIVENALDRATILVQQLKELFQRSITFPASDNSPSGELVTAANRANKWLAFDASGNPIASATTPQSTVVSAYMATVLDDTTAAAARTTLGVGAADTVTHAALDLQAVGGGGATLVLTPSASGNQSVTSLLNSLVYDVPSGSGHTFSVNGVNIASISANALSGTKSVESSGAVQAHAASKVTLSQESSAASFVTAYGPDAATYGTLKLRVAKSNGTAVDLFVVQPNGNITAGGYQTGTGEAGFQYRDDAVAAEGNYVFAIRTGGSYPALFARCDSTGWNAAACAMLIGKNSSTGRSINGAGTINASGADYAEYEHKAAGCGTVAKGQIVGFDENGQVTDLWTRAKSFGVKSTDPSLVGGDSWGSEGSLGLVKPTPPIRPEPGSEADTPEARIAFQADQADYELALARFKDRLEAARQKVDRVAYSGKVPVNVTGAAVGDYIVPVQEGEGIKGIAVASPTFDQYRIAVGQVRKILPDGRAQISVKVG